MASITIHNLDDDVKTHLRIRAAGRGRSMEEEARTILRDAVNRGEAGPSHSGRGELQVIVLNAGSEPIRRERGMKIAQLVLPPRGVARMRGTGRDRAGRRRLRINGVG